MDSWKAEVRRVRRDKIRRKKIDAGARKGRNVVKHWKSRNTVFFQWFVAPVGRKVGSLKRRVRSQLARWEMKNCTPLWREAHFQVKMYKTHQGFGPLLEVEMLKKCTPLWREAHFQVTLYKTHSASDHFWKLRCRKSARCCGAKHISKSKCTKHTMLGPLLEVEMSKKCTTLWREAHFQVKSVKNWRSRTTFGGSNVEKVHAVAAGSTFRSRNVKNTRGLGPLLEVQMSLRFASLHYTTLHSTTLHYITLHSTTLQLQLHNYTTTLHNYTTTLHYTPLH